MRTSIGNNKKLLTVRNMTKMSVLAVLSFVVMMFNFPILPAFPFLKLDFADVFPLLGGFAMGPLAGVIIVLIKNVLHLTRTTTGGVGELSNFIVGSAFVASASYVYFRNKSFKYAMIGAVVGVFSMVLAGFLSNYFIVLGLWGVPKAARMPMLINGIIPFNFIKASAVTLVTFILYKRVSPILHK